MKKKGEILLFPHISMGKGKKNREWECNLTNESSPNDKRRWGEGNKKREGGEFRKRSRVKTVDNCIREKLIIFLNCCSS